MNSLQVYPSSTIIFIYDEALRFLPVDQLSSLLNPLSKTLIQQFSTPFDQQAHHVSLVPLKDHLFLFTTAFAFEDFQFLNSLFFLHFS